MGLPLWIEILRILFRNKHLVTTPSYDTQLPDFLFVRRTPGNWDEVGDFWIGIDDKPDTTHVTITQIWFVPKVTFRKNRNKGKHYTWEERCKL